MDLQSMGWFICLWYIWILLYVKYIQCSGVAWIYGWYMGSVHLPLVNVHASICVTFSVVVLHGSMVNWGSICPGCMCILLYVKLIWCSGVAWIYGQLREEVSSALSICAFCYMWNLFGVVVLHSSVVDWLGGSICLWYMCMLLYVQLIWCSGVAWI